VLTLHLTFDHVIGALQPFAYAPELAALLPEVIGRRHGRFRPLLAGAMLVTGDLGRAVEHRATLLGHLHGGRSACFAGRRRERAHGSAHEGAGRAGHWRSPRAGRRVRVRRRDDTGRERRAGADPLRRLDPVRRPRTARSRERAAGSRHIVARGWAHRVAARIHGPRLIAAFVDDPTFATLPATCVDHFEKRLAAAAAGPTGSARACDHRRHLAKAFGGRSGVRTVDGVSFTAADGEITGLLGPHGAGKTTLLRMLATLMIPAAGSASIEGHDVVRDRYAVRRRIGVLSDARGLYPRLTARENIRYYGALNGLSGTALDTRIDELVGALGIAAIAERRAQGFSQGERMKVAIARALVHDPQTILLDEPTNGLDIMSIRALRGLLRELRAHGKCLLFSSHVMQEVSALCDSIVILGRGRVVDGTAAELLAQSGELAEEVVRLLGSGEGLPRDGRRAQRIGVGAHRHGCAQGSPRHLPRSPHHAGDARDSHRRGSRADAARAESGRAPGGQDARADAARGRPGACAGTHGVSRAAAADAHRRAEGLRGHDQSARPRRGAARSTPRSPTMSRRAGRTVRLAYDRSRDRARASIAEVEALLRAFNREWGRSRLILRGIAPDVANPLSVSRAISRHRRAPARSCSF
jgi:sodium transport system ATP-binding protein